MNTQLDLYKERIIHRAKWIAREIDAFEKPGITNEEWAELQRKADFIFGTRWPFGVRHKDLLS